jgi:hypothetical protein
MKNATTLALLGTLVLFCVSNRGAKAISSPTNTDSKKIENAVQGSGSPVSWMPFKESFTTNVEDAILIAISVDCPSRTPTGNEFELLPPTPAFVHLSSPFVSTAGSPGAALAIVSVIPQSGDKGKHQIKARATPCYGSLGQELTFKLKVKNTQ